MLIPSGLDLTELLEAGLVYCSAFQLFAVLATVAWNTRDLSGGKPATAITTVGAVYAASFLISYSSGQALSAIVLYIAFSASLLVTVRIAFNRFTLIGHLLLTAAIQMVPTGLLWGTNFLLQQSLPTNIVFASLSALLLITLPMLPLGFGKLWLQAALFGRERWLRPRAPHDGATPSFSPKVSIHVPCYAEPPDIVLKTLKSLSKLDYPNYEVLVIDNNTQDTALWQPLKVYCEQTGSPFRFLHVDNLHGAKAGALNYILPLTADDAEIIAVVDSDYVVEPDFLRRLVGFFRDEKIGFVQTSHDYRSWSGRDYQTSCYWEYMPHYKQLLPTLNEWSAAYTVGTMCLIRRTALESAGGWAEWCLTEDSEVAIRIHALGFKSIVIADTFGRGLIPETYGDYKKQRFRWTAGPAQQLKRHYRLLLSNFFGRHSPMSTQQKFFELVHCTAAFQFVASMILWLVMPAMLLLLIAIGNPLHLPEVFWLAAVSLLMSHLLLRWLEYQMLGATFKGFLLAQLAGASLLHTCEVASVKGLFSKKPLKWNRTNKFAALPAGLRALRSARTEILRGLVSLGTASVVVLYGEGSPSSVLTLGALTMATLGLSYLAAPLMAILAERDIAFGSGAEEHEPSTKAIATVQT
jgi:cellulose synthase/poly-beta-1,6-N-acetylglucosamine synthase-like glycosyltransferase